MTGSKQNVAPSSRAAHFRKTRLERGMEIAEDYTELICDLIESRGVARVCDIAREMGVSHVSVLKTIKRLVRDGLIDASASAIRLTLKGEDMAHFSKKKHLILFDFFLKLGVPEEIVAADIEGIEHHISTATFDAIQAHLKECLLLKGCEGKRAATCDQHKS